jgi:enolase
LRDQEPQRYLCKGVRKAVEHVNGVIAKALVDQNPDHQEAIDELLLSLDGSANKGSLGANALLAVSLAVAKASAQNQGLPLFAALANGEAMSIPAPMMNIINGGAHADNGLSFQEFMIMPLGFDDFAEALRAGTEIFHTLKKRLNLQQLSTSVGDEGGFAPKLPSHRAALDFIVDAIERAGYQVGQQVFLGLDLASSEFYKEGLYHLSTENLQLTAADMTDYLERLVNDYPIVSIEDGMAENDWAGWQLLSQRLGSRIQLVGDDLFVTNTRLLQRGIDEAIANAILIKPNQIGTLSETLAAIRLAKSADYRTVISHRSGETEDTTIADLAVGLDAGQIKTGSLCRTDRIAKYNQLLRINADSRYTTPYAGPSILQRLKPRV